MWGSLNRYLNITSCFVVFQEKIENLRMFTKPCQSQRCSLSVLPPREGIALGYLNFDIKVV
jgi:hypothetical protein